MQIVRPRKQSLGCLGNVIRANNKYPLEYLNLINLIKEIEESNGDGDLEKAKSGRNWIFASASNN
jgi:hypothetical protein